MSAYIALFRRTRGIAIQADRCWSDTARERGTYWGEVHVLRRLELMAVIRMKGIYV